MMKSALTLSLSLVTFGCLALSQDTVVAATPATTAVLSSSDSAVVATPVRHYRPYGAYYRANPGRYYAYRPYRPYVYRPYAAVPAYPAYGYGYPYSVRSPAYFGYRYPGARARGYAARPRVYPRYGW